MFFSLLDQLPEVLRLLTSELEQKRCYRAEGEPASCQRPTKPETSSSPYHVCPVHSGDVQGSPHLFLHCREAYEATPCQVSAAIYQKHLSYML